jgi:hypothetical protein
MGFKQLFLYSDDRLAREHQLEHQLHTRGGELGHLEFFL